MDPVHMLRIRIPPFEEPEQDLVIPAWPKREGTLEEKLLIDRDYVEALGDLIALRRSMEDRVTCASEVMKYLYKYPDLLEHYPDFAEDMYFYAEKYMIRADNLETPDEDTTTIHRLKERVRYYGAKLRATIVVILWNGDI
jgi:hypothetical protein